MAVPKNKIQQYAELVMDRSSFVSELELRRIVKECTHRLRSSSSADATQLWTVIGIAYTRLGKHDDALEAYRCAYKLDPKSPTTALNLAVGLMDLGETEKALELWAGIADEPGERGVIALANLSEAFMRIGAVDDAWDALRDAVGRADLTDVHTLFVLAHQTAALGADRDALELLARHISIRFGIPLGNRPPIDVVLSIHPPVLGAIVNSSRPLAQAIQRELAIGDSLDHLPHAPESECEQDDVARAEAKATFDAFAELRARANEAALSPDEQ